jgi:hypothetical protein
MGLLTAELRKIQMVVFDRLMHSSDNPDEARLLAEASKQIPKDRRVVIVDSDLAYGNARALALDLNKVLDEEELLFLAYDEKGLAWANSNQLPAALFSTKTRVSSAELWNKLIRAKVSIYDSHNWWRTRDQLIQRSLLEGSFKIQLWHGAAGPVVKGVGLERLANSKTFWHFSAVATSSSGFDVLINEAREASFRSQMSVGAKETINDVEYRVVSELMNSNRKDSGDLKSPEILIAPTYPEDTEREDALLTWLKTLATCAVEIGLKVTIRLHPGTSRRVRKKVATLQNEGITIDQTSKIVLTNFATVVTDFSAVAHDALLLNLKVVSIWTDIQGYAKNCPIRFDEDQKRVTYILENLSEALELLKQAVFSDPLAEDRKRYIDDSLSNLGALPGVNTRETVLAALNAV